MKLFWLWIVMGLAGWLLVGTIVVALVFAWKPVIAIACLLLLLKMLYSERRGKARRGW